MQACQDGPVEGRQCCVHRIKLWAPPGVACVHVSASVHVHSCNLTTGYVAKFMGVYAVCVVESAFVQLWHVV
jgi:hypothetical protein